MAQAAEYSYVLASEGEDEGEQDSHPDSPVAHKRTASPSPSSADENENEEPRAKNKKHKKHKKRPQRRAAKEAEEAMEEELAQTEADEKTLELVPLEDGYLYHAVGFTLLPQDKGVLVCLRPGLPRWWSTPLAVTAVGMRVLSLCPKLSLCRWHPPDRAKPLPGPWLRAGAQWVEEKASCVACPTLSEWMSCAALLQEETEGAASFRTLPRYTPGVPVLLPGAEESLRHFHATAEMESGAQDRWVHVAPDNVPDPLLLTTHTWVLAQPPGEAQPPATAGAPASALVQVVNSIPPVTVRGVPDEVTLVEWTKQLRTTTEAARQAGRKSHPWSAPAVVLGQCTQRGVSQSWVDLVRTQQLSIESPRGRSPNWVQSVFQCLAPPCALLALRAADKHTLNDVLPRAASYREGQLHCEWPANYNDAKMLRAAKMSCALAYFALHALASGDRATHTPTQWVAWQVFYRAVCVLASPGLCGDRLTWSLHGVRLQQWHTASDGTADYSVVQAQLKLPLGPLSTELLKWFQPLKPKPTEAQVRELSTLLQIAANKATEVGDYKGLYEQLAGLGVPQHWVAGVPDPVRFTRAASAAARCLQFAYWLGPAEPPRWGLPLRQVMDDEGAADSVAMPLSAAVWGHEALLSARLHCGMGVAGQAPLVSAPEGGEAVSWPAHARVEPLEWGGPGVHTLEGLRAQAKELMAQVAVLRMRAEHKDKVVLVLPGLECPMSFVRLVCRLLAVRPPDGVERKAGCANVCRVPAGVLAPCALVVLTLYNPRTLPGPDPVLVVNADCTPPGVLARLVRGPAPVTFGVSTTRPPEALRWRALLPELTALSVRLSEVSEEARALELGAPRVPDKVHVHTLVAHDKDKPALAPEGERLFSGQFGVAVRQPCSWWVAAVGDRGACGTSATWREPRDVRVMELALVPRVVHENCTEHAVVVLPDPEWRTEEWAWLGGVVVVDPRPSTGAQVRTLSVPSKGCQVVTHGRALNQAHPNLSRAAEVVWPHMPLLE